MSQVLALFGLACALCTQGAPSGHDKWQEAILHSKLAQGSPLVHRILKAQRTPISTFTAVKVVQKHAAAPIAAADNSQGPQTPLPPGVTLGAYSPVDDETAAKFMKAVERWQNEADECIAMYHSGRTGEARTRMMEDLSRFPSEMFAVPLADWAIQRGDYEEAFKVGVPFIRSGTPEIVLRASLAAAMLGHAYPGQVEYCVELMKRTGEGNYTTPYPSEVTSANCAFLSSLAMLNEIIVTGTSSADPWPYIAICERLNPDVQDLDDSIGHVYHSMGLFSKAIAAYKHGITLAPTTVLSDLMRTACKQDQLSLDRVGDQPVHIPWAYHPAKRAPARQRP